MKNAKDAKRKVCVVTGTRAEYGLLKPVMEAVRESGGLKLQVVASGMHLSREFGLSKNDILRDGFAIDAEVDMLLSGDDNAAMAKSVGVGILGMTDAIRMLDPRFVVVLGDRVEAFAAATAGALLKKAVAQIHGGDKARGGYDDYMRHAITKMAHLHFTASPQSRERVLRLGEDPRHVYLTGAPGLDTILRRRFPSRAALFKKLGVRGDGPVLAVVQHSVSTEPEKAAGQMRETVRAVETLGFEAVFLYPNSDAGGRAVIAELEKIKGRPGFHLFKTLPRDDYLALIKRSSALVGNSSSGIIESTPLRVPAVNVGDRQKDRECAENVVHCPHDRKKIAAAVRYVLNDPGYRRILNAAQSPYGDGTAGERIARILETVKLGPELLTKQIAY